MTKPSLEQREDRCAGKTGIHVCPDRRKGERRKADPRYSGLHNGTLIYSLGGFSFHDDRRSGKDRRKP